MKRLGMGLVIAALLTTAAITLHASGQRGALAILNEPCADIANTYAWIDPGTHSKLYLIMDLNSLHEPGQGNHGLRACDGYRYEFHIAMGTSLADKLVYRVEFTKRLTPEAAPSATDAVGGGNEIFWQLTGATETMKVTRVVPTGTACDVDGGACELPGDAVVLGSNLPVLPNNHGPQTDRFVYGLGGFKGYDSGDRSSREQGLYDQPFVDTFIQTLPNGARIIAGQFDEPAQLDQKGLFDLVNLSSNDLGGIPGARRPPTKDVFTGFNTFAIALELPITDVFPAGIPHNGHLNARSTDSLQRVSARAMRQRIQIVDASNLITGLTGTGGFVQVRRNALPLFNSVLVGTQRQTLYLRSSPLHDVTNFGADVSFPVLVRDADRVGMYSALGVPQSVVDTVLKGPRPDIFDFINLGRAIPVADGSTGDVITLDAAIDSSFPNGRQLGGGSQPNMNQVNVNSALLSLILAANPAAGLATGVEVNDKNYLPRFPFLALAHQGVLQGHGDINVPTVPDIPVP